MTGITQAKIIIHSSEFIQVSSLVRQNKDVFKISIWKMLNVSLIDIFKTGKWEPAL